MVNAEDVVAVDVEEDAVVATSAAAKIMYRLHAADERTSSPVLQIFNVKDTPYP